MKYSEIFHAINCAICCLLYFFQIYKGRTTIYVSTRGVSTISVLVNPFVYFHYCILTTAGVASSYSSALYPPMKNEPSTNSQQAQLSFFISCNSHVLPILFIFLFLNRLLHVPLFISPCWFHRNDFIVVLLTGFLGVFSPLDSLEFVQHYQCAQGVLFSQLRNKGRLSQLLPHSTQARIIFF